MTIRGSVENLIEALTSEAERRLEEHIRACFTHWSKTDPDVRGLREGHIGELMSLFRNAQRAGETALLPSTSTTEHEARTAWLEAYRLEHFAGDQRS